jgi:cell wall-associated NlpC family hydrolase
MRRLATPLLLTFLIFFSYLSGQLQKNNTVVNFPSVDSLVAYAKTFVGATYKYGGNTPEGFDCSGFVSFVFAHFNITLPRSSVDYVKIGVPVPIDSSRKGDIILFSGTDNNLSKVGHVGIVISDQGEEICFIHSSSSKKHRGIIISELKGTGYVDRFIGIRRMTTNTLLKSE